MSDEAYKMKDQSAEAKQNAIKAGLANELMTNEEKLAVQREATLQEESRREDADLLLLNQKDKVKAYEKASESAMKELREFKVNPNKYWEDAGLAGGIALALASGAAAFASGYSQGKVPNVVSGMISAGIKAAIQSQVSQQKKLLSVAEMTTKDRELAYRRLDSYSKDAERLAKSVVAHQLVEISTKGNDEKLSAAADIAIADLNSQLAEDKNKNRKKVNITSTSGFKEVRNPASGAARQQVAKDLQKDVGDAVVAYKGMNKLGKDFHRLTPNAVSGAAGGKQTEEFKARSKIESAAVTKALFGAKASEGDRKSVEDTLPKTFRFGRGGYALGDAKIAAWKEKIVQKAVQYIRRDPRAFNLLPSDMQKDVWQALKGGK